MQEVRVKDIKTKEGVTERGARAGQPWELVIIVGDDGSEFTTFDTGAKEVGIGGLIELEPVIKAGKTNFTKFNIKEKGSSAATPPGKTNGQRSDMTKEDWAKKDRIERASIETQTAFKGIIDLLVAKIILPEGSAAKEALEWASSHFKGKDLETVLNRMPGLVADPPGEKESSPYKQFKNVGEFFTDLHAKGLSRQQVIDELIRLKLINTEMDLPKLDLVIAWEALGDAIIPEETKGK